MAAFDEGLGPAGVTGHQFNVLITIARSEPLNVNKLAIAVGMHPSTIPRVLAPLMREGLIQIQAGADRRERRIAITRRGRATVARAYPLWAEVQRRIVDRLGVQEWSSAMTILRDLRRTLRE